MGPSNTSAPAAQLDLTLSQAQKEKEGTEHSSVFQDKHQADQLQRSAKPNSVSESSNNPFHLSSAVNPKKLPAMLDSNAVTDESQRVERALLELEEAMQTLPDADWIDYAEAKRRVPDLIAQESSPLAFLRVHDFCPEKAAVCLAKHWERRKHLFSDRAFRPLFDWSGEGAMSSEDITVANILFNYQLPDDSNGWPVVYNDPSLIKRPNREVQHSRIRLQFFVITRACLTSTVAQTEGIRLIRLFRTPEVDNIQGSQLKASLDGAFPARTFKILGCALPPPGARKIFSEVFFPMLTKGYNGNFSTEYILAMSKEDMLQKLVDRGLAKDSLPESLGGTWIPDGFDCFDKKKPAIVERGSLQVDDGYKEYESSTSKRKEEKSGSVEDESQSEEDDIETNHLHSDHRATATLSADGLDCLAELADSRIPKEDAKARKRRLDVLYSRKRRQREQNEIAQMQEQCDQLLRTSMVLKNEKRKLDGLLNEAQRFVATMEGVMGRGQDGSGDQLRTVSSSDVPTQLQSSPEALSQLANALLRNAGTQAALRSSTPASSAFADVATPVQQIPTNEILSMLGDPRFHPASLLSMGPNAGLLASDQELRASILQRLLLQRIARGNIAGELGSLIGHGIAIPAPSLPVVPQAPIQSNPAASQLLRQLMSLISTPSIPSTLINSRDLWQRNPMLSQIGQPPVTTQNSFTHLQRLQQLLASPAERHNSQRELVNLLRESGQSDLAAILEAELRERLFHDRSLG